MFRALLPLSAIRQPVFLNGLDLALGDRLREHSGADALLAVASELIGGYLGANAVVYGEVDAAGEIVTVRGGWADRTVPRPAGSFRMDELGVGDLLRRGQVSESGPGATAPTGRAAAVYRDLGRVRGWGEERGRDKEKEKETNRGHIMLDRK